MNKSEQKNLEEEMAKYNSCTFQKKTYLHRKALKTYIIDTRILSVTTLILCIILGIALVSCVGLKLEVMKLQKQAPQSVEQQVKDLDTPPPPLKLIGGY